MRVAVIPARGGSKRIPRKNINVFCGKPIISWPIEIALASQLFDQIVVSTDDAEIAAIAKNSGATVPYLRPKTLADDFTDTKSVIRHAISELDLQSDLANFVCCIYPTSVFLTVGLLKEGFDLVSRMDSGFAFSIKRVDSSLLRSFTRDTGGRLKMILPDNQSIRTQDLPEVFCDAAQFYWGAVSTWQSNQEIFGENSRGILVANNSCQDIDTPEDWARAELIFKDFLKIDEKKH